MWTSWPVTVTVRGVFQLAGVKVRPGTEGMPWAGSQVVRAIVTSAVGLLVRATVKVAVPPASSVTGGEVIVTCTPATSRSWLVRLTLVAKWPSYTGSPAEVGERAIV